MKTYNEYDLKLEKIDNKYYLKIYQEFYTLLKLYDKSTAYIPIKDISHLEFSKRGYDYEPDSKKGYIIKIKLKNNNHKIEKEVTSYFMGETKKTETTNSYIINVQRTIDEENLQERITKAFEYLKELTQEKTEDIKEKF